MSDSQAGAVDLQALEASCGLLLHHDERHDKNSACKHDSKVENVEVKGREDV